MKHGSGLARCGVFTVLSILLVHGFQLGETDFDIPRVGSVVGLLIQSQRIPVAHEKSQINPIFFRHVPDYIARHPGILSTLFYAGTSNLPARLGPRFDLIKSNRIAVPYLHNFQPMFGHRPSRRGCGVVGMVSLCDL